MSAEEGIAQKKVSTRRAEPDEETHFSAQFSTTRGIAHRTPYTLENAVNLDEQKTFQVKNP